MNAALIFESRIVKALSLGVSAGFVGVGCNPSRWAFFTHCQIIGNADHSRIIGNADHTNLFS